MIEYTMELDVEVSDDEMKLFTSLAGIKHAHGYGNTVTLHYAQPLAVQEMQEITAAIRTLHKAGIQLLSIGENIMQDKKLLREAITDNLLVY